MIDKYYLIKYVYNTPELTSNVFRFCDGALGAFWLALQAQLPRHPKSIPIMTGVCCTTSE